MLTFTELSVAIDRSQNETHHRLAFFHDGVEAVAYLTLDDLNTLARAIDAYVAEHTQ